ncbi:MAG TPA: sigma 54-interacting transcriptional regulator [Polyangia bacterium]|nr:sigma 54-interacting transcriptional regulator [Polyangia bacterium]
MEVENELQTFVADASPETPAERNAFQLSVVGGPSVGAVHIIDLRDCRIGKAQTNDVRLADPSASRFHCVIEWTPRGLLLRDLGSTNGTQVGGCFVQSAYLAPMVPIQIGASTLRLTSLDRPLGSAGATPAAYDRGILGSSQAIQKVMALLPRIARAGFIVLLEGETGTGKTLLAEMIHQAGPRASAPFVSVDCGSIPPNLIESELFGHERGAFTGAAERRVGAFEAASGGTVFLDEIGELPLALQPKLLRVLEERIIKRVGGQRAISVDMKIIAATNRDLQKEVASGQFRADLYYRLDSLRVRLPPLRERREDIPGLIEKFARRVQSDVNPNFVQKLILTLARRPDWPGNVRELRNAVEKAILLGDVTPGLVIEETERVRGFPVDNGGQFQAGTSFHSAKERAVAAWEREFLQSLLSHSAGNLSHAARVAQMDRTHLRELLRRHRLLA